MNCPSIVTHFHIEVPVDLGQHVCEVLFLKQVTGLRLLAVMTTETYVICHIRITSHDNTDMNVS